jgi:predicted membrane-bound mannosyltransferase
VARLAGGLVVVTALAPLAVAASVGALIVRLRGARGTQRQQLKWFASAASLVTVIAIPVLPVRPSRRAFHAIA